MTQMLFNPTGLQARVLPLHIGSIGRFNSFSNVALFSAEGNFTSGTWFVNNQAVYIPIALPARFTVARFYVANGAAVSGTMDIGLFDSEGNKLISTGSAAPTGTSVVQYVDVTDRSFPAGNYFLGLVISTTASRVAMSTLGAVPDGEMCGATLEVLGSAVLPTTMAPSARVHATYPCFGFTQSATL